jgi:putative peptide zinc metalloprotease protein
MSLTPDAHRGGDEGGDGPSSPAPPASPRSPAAQPGPTAVGQLPPAVASGLPPDPPPAAPEVRPPLHPLLEAPPAPPPPPGPRAWRDQDVLRPTQGISLFGSVARQAREDQRNARILTRTQRGGRVVSIVSAKGGVGKTTTTRMLGEVLAARRGDRIVAMDCNPDTGSLAMRLSEVTSRHTVTDLVRDALQLRRYSDVQAYVTECPSRLSVLASSHDPDVSRSLGGEEYRTALAVLSYHWSVVLCDLGTGLTDPPTSAVIRLSHQHVVVTGAHLDEAKVGVFTLDWLARYYPERALRSVVVINDRGGRGRTDVDARRVEEYFASRCRAVIRLPWDRELARGGAPRWERLGRATREAYLDLAAAVAEEFSTGPGEPEGADAGGGETPGPDHPAGAPPPRGAVTERTSADHPAGRQ